MSDRTRAERIEFWDAVSDIIVACGGNSACTSITRQAAVVRIEAALKALALPPDSGWRPIETAPRDGTDVLVALPELNGWPGYVDIAGWRDTWGAWICGEGKELTPTHWMPLPAPPSEVKS